MYHGIVKLFWDYPTLWINSLTSLPHTSIFTIRTIRGRSRSILITPNIKQAAINHYGCPTLLGIQVTNHEPMDNTIL
jgi:hypothetical protein